jgi:hypothetical protein
MLSHRLRSPAERVRKRGLAGRRRALLTGTRLAGVALITALVVGTALPAWADGGNGSGGGGGGSEARVGTGIEK